MILFVFDWKWLFVLLQIHGKREITNATSRQHRRAAYHNLQTASAERKSPTFGGARSLEGKAAEVKESAIRSSQDRGSTIFCADNFKTSSCREF